MLARYKIYRGKRPPGVSLPEGIRQDTRKHTRHCLRPTADIVERFLANPTDEAWGKFADQYVRLLARRYEEDAATFNELAELAKLNDVFLGCSCPTEKNPDVNHCHTVLALRFMQERYPDLTVEYPKAE